MKLLEISLLFLIAGFLYSSAAKSSHQHQTNVVLKQDVDPSQRGQGFLKIRQKGSARVQINGFNTSIQQIPLPEDWLTEETVDSWCTYEKCAISPRTYYYPVATNFSIAAYTDNSGQGHVILFGKTQTGLRHLAPVVNGTPAKVAGIYGFYDGSFATALYVDAKDPRERKMYLQFYRDDLSVKWSTLLNSAIAVPDRNVGDFRLAYGEGYFAIYFAVFGVDNFANSTNGDQLSFVDDRGKLHSSLLELPGQTFVKTGGTWLCSHGLAQLVDYHSAERQFATVCAADRHPQGISLGDSLSGTLLHIARGDGRGRTSAQLGQLAQSEFGWKLLFNALDGGIGFITIYNENDVITGKQSFDPVAWISKGGGLSERDPVIARLYPDRDVFNFVESYLVGWHDTARDRYVLGITNTFGQFFKEPSDVSSFMLNEGNISCRGRCLSWGNRDDSMRTLPDGSVGWIFAPPLSPCIWIFSSRGFRFAFNVQNVNTVSNNVPSGWGLWSGWLPCSRSCSSGITTRVRSCLAGGCTESDAYEVKSCNTNPCSVPIKCTFLELQGSFVGDLFLNGVRQFGYTESEAKKKCSLLKDLCFGISRSLSGGFYFYFLKTSTKLKQKEPGSSWTMNCTEWPEWSVWSTWIRCSATCGGGVQRRQRFCDGNVPGSKYCMGKTEEFQQCNTGRCPDWSLWAAWQPCSRTCNAGFQKRARTCIGDYRKACQKLAGPRVEQQSCFLGKCSEWGEWSAWSDCTTTCGEGFQERTRECFGDFPCQPDQATRRDARPCNLAICPYWSKWGLWSKCGASCGRSQRFRTRDCMGDFPDEKGCPLDGESTETEPCNLGRCPFWGEWKSWGACSEQCGEGFRLRSRDCLGDFPSAFCPPGDVSDREVCDLGECPYWDKWVGWSQCSSSCGAGIRTRTRSCLGDFPCPEGEPASMLRNCNLGDCPSWGRWSPWGPCTVTCGQGGSRSRSRPCLGDFPDLCDKSKLAEIDRCLDLSDCPRWTFWTEWSACSSTCGSGVSVRTRTCDASDVATCYLKSENKTKLRSFDVSIRRNRLGSHEMIESANCTLGQCSYWLQWRAWGSCSATCGLGIRQRTRECAGDFIHMCTSEGSATERMSCSRGLCGVWSEWSGWGTCSKSCGVGEWSRNRQCFGDFKDTCVGASNQTRPCNVGDCIRLCAPNPCKNGGRCRQNLHLARLYHCVCPNGWMGKHCDYAGPDFVCGSDSILLAFDRRVVEDEGLIADDPRYVSLASRDSPLCISFMDRSNETDWFLVILPSPVDVSCGSVLEVTPSEYRIRNRVIWQAEEKNIRSTVVILDFTCIYQRNFIVSSESSSSGILSIESYKKEIEMVTANGVFEVDISLFRDPSFQQQITPETASSPVSFAEGEVVFVSVELKSKDLFPPGASVLVMDTCFVTSEQSTREPLTYLFHDGCPVSPFVVLLSNGDSRSGRFSVRIFGWTNVGFVMENVYIHCIVSVCDSRNRICKPVCSTDRRKRSSANNVRKSVNNKFNQLKRNWKSLRSSKGNAAERKLSSKRATIKVIAERRQQLVNADSLQDDPVRNSLGLMNHKGRPYRTIEAAVPPLPDGNAAVNLSTSFSRFSFDLEKMVSAGPLEVFFIAGSRHSREVHEDPPGFEAKKYHQPSIWIVFVFLTAKFSVTCFYCVLTKRQSSS